MAINVKKFAMATLLVGVSIVALKMVGEFLPASKGVPIVGKMFE